MSEKVSADLRLTDPTANRGGAFVHVYMWDANHHSDLHGHISHTECTDILMFIFLW